MCCGEGHREGRACWAEGTVVTKVLMKAFVEKMKIEGSFFIMAVLIYS